MPRSQKPFVGTVITTPSGLKGTVIGNDLEKKRLTVKLSNGNITRVDYAVMIDEQSPRQTQHTRSGNRGRVG